MQVLKIKLLFIFLAVFGGTGWIFLPSQIEFISPELAVSYRFILAGFLLLLYGFFKNKKFPILKKSNLILTIVQGATLFCFNYMLCYFASRYIISGMIALSVSIIILPTLILARIFLKDKIKLHVVLGALIGLMGILMVYWKELSFSFDNQAFIGFLLCFLSTFLSASGTVISGKLTREGIPVLWVTALSMLSGGLIGVFWTVLIGKPITFSLEPRFLVGFIYLSVIMSTFFFLIFLTLVDKLGSSKASYAWILTPVVALNLSYLFEGFQWDKLTISGTLLVIIGGFVAIYDFKNRLKKETISEENQMA